ncbi:MAG: hypothetical protein KGI69_03515 [Patescibacteria group bacterium]|nr:hypothetical protein [Patescibacteria group bacterium]
MVIVVGLAAIAVIALLPKSGQIAAPQQQTSTEARPVQTGQSEGALHNGAAANAVKVRISGITFR